MLAAFDIYSELHYAVDDPMLGLYEWLQFRRIFDDFKDQFEKYVIVADAGFDAERHILFQLGVQRVRECSQELERSFDTAMQDEFIAPCDDTHDALLNLIELYARTPSSL